MSDSPKKEDLEQSNNQDLPSLVDDDSDDYKIDGPFKRNSALILAIVASFVIGPFLSPLLQSYRAIVLEAKDGKIFLAFSRDKAPAWVDVDGFKEGDIVLKELGDWKPQLVPEREDDHALRRTYKRYVRTYAGEVVKISKLGAQYSAQLKLDDGSSITIELWGEHLVHVQVGTRLKKYRGSWEPVVDDL